MLESSSGDLYSVLNSYGVYQMATHVVRTDLVNEVYEFRKAKTSCCALRKPSLNFLVQEKCMSVELARSHSGSGRRTALGRS